MIEMLRSIKRFIINRIEGIRYYNMYCRKYPESGSCVYLIGTSTNGNLGDQAISYTQKQVLEQLQEKKIVEITITEYWRARLFLKKRIQPIDTIFIQGGGNFGIEYWLAEESRRDLIKLFHKTKIVSFPQTIDYPETIHGKRELKKSCKIYQKHENLHIFAREIYSFDKMADVYSKNNIYLTPDIVFLCDIRPDFVKKNDKILLCLRNDCEAKLTSQERNQIELEVRKFSDYEYTDTCISQNVLPEERKAAIKNKLNEFAQSKLVITDRLHGMVLSALASVPCIVFRNYNKKVEGVYQWLKYNPSIVMCDSVDEIPTAIKKALSVPVVDFDNNRFCDKFSELFSLMK